MKQGVKRLLKNIVGLFLILVGIVFGFLPILQGWVFIILGLSMIEHPWKHAAHQWLARESRFYRLASAMYFRTKRRMARRKL